MRTSRIGSMFMGIAVLALAVSAQPAKSNAAGAFAGIPLPEGLTAESAALVVSGKISPSSPVYLDLETIRSFPATSFTTIDPWDGKTHVFTGVLLAPLLQRLGIEGEATSILLGARNSYTTAIRRADYERCGYILAYAIDGKDFGADPATKRRGPLAIAIDFTANPTLSVDIYKHQLIWQLTGIIAQ